ncbi:MAG: hypothetical protein GY864_00405 [Desulfobacterales bacterium]|nr:hypothetical protein [Desulfobacterales bacterium]
MLNNKKVRLIQYILLIMLLIYAALFYAQKIQLTTADLGRHIKNGEVFLNDFKVNSSNYYSYTEPNFPSNTHHWGGGVVYYVIWKYFGFSGLSILNVLLYVLAFLFFFNTANKIAAYKYALLFSLLCVPLVSFRAEIRPEAFSCLFLGMLFYLLTLYNDNRTNFKKVLVIPAIMVCWVNIHIFFILGIFLIGTYWIKSLINKDGKEKQYSLVLGLSIIACMISPFGVYAFLEPFFIFKEYGYMIAENQSVLFMQKRFPGNLRYLYFEVVFAIAAIGFIIIIIKKSIKEYMCELIFFCFFSALALKVSRCIPIFGFVMIPLLSANYKWILEDFECRGKKYLRYALVTLFVVSIGVFLTGTRIFYPVKQKIGLGLFSGINASADFFRGNNIQGPVFNNYDIGGYLIFHLFPEQRVFTDNRPEAYSVSFFKDTYVPMQENEKKWEEVSRKYKFNAIYFYRHDMTPWAQPFLIRRIKDKNWAPVYVDAYTVILLRRNRVNAGLIEKYELPQTLFKIRKG